jgi:hypothetical protein
MRETREESRERLRVAKFWRRQRQPRMAEPLSLAEQAGYVAIGAVILMGLAALGAGVGLPPWLLAVGAAVVWTINWLRS